MPDSAAAIAEQAATEASPTKAAQAHTPDSMASLDDTNAFAGSENTTEMQIIDRDKAGIKKGSIWRWKYRKMECKRDELRANGHPDDFTGELPPAKKQRLDPNVVGWHPKNRNGNAPQPMRCEQLAGDLVGKFDPEEADHGAVAVEENPKTPTRFLEHTIKVCQGHDRLAVPVTNTMLAAAVGHGHLNQTCRNFLNGAKSTSPRLANVRDKSGALQIKMLEGLDLRMASYIKRGLEWEILSYKLEEEEPAEGIACVQLTLNDAQSVAMAKYEMQAVAHMEQVILPSLELPRASGITQTVQLKLEQINIYRERIADAGFAELALSEDFEGVVNLVLSNCSGPWLRKMLQWHTDWINSQQRRISYATLAGLSYIPLAYPRARHSLFAKAFDKKSKQTSVFCNSVSPAFLKGLGQSKYTEVLRKAESLLEQVQVTNQELGAYADLPNDKLASMLLNIDIIVGEGLLGSGPERQMKNLNKAEEIVRCVLNKYLSPKGRSLLPALPSATDSVQAGLQENPPAAIPGPAIIGYNAKGQPLEPSQPTAVQIQQQDVLLNWQTTLSNVDAANAGRCTVFAAIHGASGLIHKQDDLVQIIGRADGKGPCTVRSSKEISAAQLMLLPLPQDICQVSQKQGTGNTPGVKVPGLMFYLNNSAKRAGEKTFLPPFWLIRRSPIEAEANVHVKECSFNSIDSVALWDGAAEEFGSSTAVRSTVLPLITNLEVIPKGVELVLHQPKEEKSQQPKLLSWTNAKSK